MAKNRVITYIKKGINQTADIFIHECKSVFTDGGVMLIFFIAGLLYPLLYSYVYMTESVDNVNVAVIDESCSEASRRFIQKLSSTREVEVINCINMDEAQKMFVRRDVHGIVLIPRDYNDKLMHNEQATISMYENMSCFMVYKSIALAVNMVMLDESKNIQLKRYEQKNIIGEQGLQMVKPLPYEENILYNPGNGFSSFFVPGILMIIIHQLLFLGIGMLAGTAREENAYGKLFMGYKNGRGLYRIVFGKSAAYFLIYAILAVYIVVIVPRIFNIPHIGNVLDIYGLLLPFLLATIFFSMTISVVIKNRETGMVMFLFFSVILVFLSGISWPYSNFPKFWTYFSYIFPSTFGVRGYIKINSMAATLGQVAPEYWALWLQVIIYYFTACGATYWAFRREIKKK